MDLLLDQLLLHDHQSPGKKSSIQVCHGRIWQDAQTIGSYEPKESRGGLAAQVPPFLKPTTPPRNLYMATLKGIYIYIYINIYVTISGRWFLPLFFHVHPYLDDDPI